MRLLHACAGNLFGGVEAMLVTEARFAETEPGLEQHFAVGFGGALDEALRGAGAPVHRYDGPRLSRPWTVLKARRQFARILDRVAPDVVVAHSNWPMVVLGPTARRRGFPLAFWLHDGFQAGHFLDRIASRTRPDFAIANSRFNGERSLPGQFPGVPWDVIYPASSPPPPGDREADRRAVRREVGSPMGSVVIVQTSRLERWKGHSQLLAAAAEVRAEAPWEIWFAGGVQRPHERAFRDELEAQAASSGLADRVRFLGQRSDIPRVLASADFHCQANLEPRPSG